MFVEWAGIKNSGKYEFGSLPILELGDGTTLSQSIPILRYVCRTYGGDKMCHTADALVEWNADSLGVFWYDDFIRAKLAPMNMKYIYNPNPDTNARDAEIETILV
jgi:glutathione S-transferase